MMTPTNAVLAAALIGVISTISAAFVTGLFHLWQARRTSIPSMPYQSLTVVADAIKKTTELLDELKSLREEYHNIIDRMEARNKEEHIRMVKLLEQLADAIAPRTPRF